MESRDAGMRHGLHGAEKSLRVCTEGVWHFTVMNVFDRENAGRERIRCRQVIHSAAGGNHMKTAAGIQRLTEFGCEQKAEPGGPAFCKAGDRLLDSCFICTFSIRETIVDDMIKEECAAAF